MTNKELKELADGVISKTLYGPVPIETAGKLAQGVLDLCSVAAMDADHRAKLIKGEDAFGKRIAALQKQIAELEYQQETDTATIGILADVVDVLWEDDTRCLNHGYGNAVAKAKEVVAKANK